MRVTPHRSAYLPKSGLTMVSIWITRPARHFGGGPAPSIKATGALEETVPSRFEIPLWTVREKAAPGEQGRPDQVLRRGLGRSGSAHNCRWQFELAAAAA